MTSGPRRGVPRAAVLLSALSLAAAFWLLRPGPESEATIPPGGSAREVARMLREQGIIRSPRLFRLLAKLSGLDRAIKPGAHRLRRNMSSVEALWRLSHDQTPFVRVVIPEGFRASQIAERLEAHGVAKAGEFTEHVRAHRLEGYLFPATYDFIRGMPASDAAHRMYQEFKRTAGPELLKGSRSRLSLHQAVILASIVEREAVLPEERPMIAAVYLNRLARRKPLEADPTVQYALGYWKKGVTYRDLAADSPYNTYAHLGLPPGPICSPGLGSVRAVLSPAETGALYFVANNTGGHTFTDNYEEHLKAKSKAKRERLLLRRGR